MSDSRRTFLAGAAGAAMLAQLGAAARAATVTRTGGDVTSRMTWLNEPASVTYPDGGVVARAKPKTDFWRKTFYGYVTDNGHFLHLPVSGEFTFEARVLGKYASLYDQAGLMVRLDEKHWMKCGSEFFEQRRWASVVFTHDYSDWSTLDDLSQSGPVWWRVARKRDSIEAQCSTDGQTFLTVRQGYFPAAVEVQVGLMCAAPEGAGFEAAFDHVRLEKA
jgi:regulation of enolase protein 1 (concanavalin A-like superfamily)